MHHELIKALWDFYPPEDKNDFFPAYHYMKHIDRFMYYALLQSGLLPKETKEKLDEDVDQMVKYHVQRISETALTFDTSIYHGKVVKLQDVIKLVTQKKDLNLSPPEKVMPFKVARDVILKANDTIAVGTCPCRANMDKPCLPPPQEVCFFVGDPFASFIAEENPKYRKVSQDEAVKILEFAHQKGFVHTAYFKKEAGNRFVAICNCCGCCCLGIRMWNQLEGMVPIMAPSGYVAEVNDDCNGCAACADHTCKFNSISMDEKKQRAVINLARCMGCGVCVDVCPTKAISLRREPSKGDPLDIEALKSQSATVSGKTSA
jgi:Pyruvate/2-oxoacid:ferredoxin oxidoreductase delta subunit